MRRAACVLIAVVVLAALAGRRAQAQPEPSPSETKKSAAKNKSAQRQPARADRATSADRAKTDRAKTGAAQRIVPKTSDARGHAAGVAQVALTPGREAAAITFARLHHPELADLLEHLNDVNRSEYEKALRELFQASERLARISERSPERYELALRAWKIDSRVRLLAARMAMSDDPALEEVLKAALQERLDVRLQQLRDDRDRTAERLDTLNRSIETIEADREAALQKELERVKRSVGGAKKRPTPAGDDAG